MSSPIILGDGKNYEQMAAEAEAHQMQEQMIGALVEVVTQNVLGYLLNSYCGIVYFDENKKHVPKEESLGFEPEKQHKSDSGYDLKSPFDFTLYPGQRKVLDLRIGLLMMSHIDAFIIPRSGLAAKNGITIVNAPGLIDSSYTNPWAVILLNTGTEPLEVKRGDRIAQARFQFRGLNMDMKEFTGNLEELREKIQARSGGIGSTGK